MPKMIGGAGITGEAGITGMAGDITKVAGISMGRGMGIEAIDNAARAESEGRARALHGEPGLLRISLPSIASRPRHSPDARNETFSIGMRFPFSASQA